MIVFIEESAVSDAESALISKKNFGALAQTSLGFFKTDP